MRKIITPFLAIFYNVYLNWVLPLLCRYKGYLGFNLSDSYWLNAWDLGLSNNWAKEWPTYINSLNMASIILFSNNDELVWAGNHILGQVFAKHAYFVIADSSSYDFPKWWFEIVWKWHLPSKLKCFLWLYFEICLLTWSQYLCFV